MHPMFLKWQEKLCPWEEMLVLQHEGIMRTFHEEVSTESSWWLQPAPSSWSQLTPLLCKPFRAHLYTEVLAIINVRDGAGVQGSLPN